MSYLRFLGFELVAATLWNTAFCLLGYFVAAQVDRLQVILERSGWVILGAFMLLFFAWRYFGQRMKQRIRQERHKAQRRARDVILR
jgi:membrane protein DedA with SNARE-associated domain